MMRREVGASLTTLLYRTHRWQTGAGTRRRPGFTVFLLNTGFFAILLLTPYLLFQLHFRDTANQVARQERERTLRRLKQDQQLVERMLDPRMQLSLRLQSILFEAQRRYLSPERPPRESLQRMHRHLRQRLAPLARLVPSLRWQMLEYQPYYSGCRVEGGYYWYGYNSPWNFAADVEGFPFLL
ncbi:MAG TPA: hypothetical protein PKO06_14020, partial [Candidatus Ozemobacteraceae bacterium]|nr:hypothetical protein [Candidatus Ozemobacteraceae bacterium]